MTDGYVEDEGIYEVEDLLEHKIIDHKDFYLVKWKGFKDTSWEPDENIGQELQSLKDKAKGGGAADKDTRKRKKEGKEGKKEKKEKKKRRRGSSEEKKRKRGSDSGSESSRDGGGMPPGFPGMPPGMPMMPGMMPGMDFPPMMPGMMPGMPGMMPGDPKGMGKGMPPMPPMMGKGMPGMKGMPPFPPDMMMMKGMPPMMGCKGGCKGKGGFKGLPPPPMMGVMRESLDTQRFAVERKRRFRDAVSSLHKHLAKEDASGFDKEKNESTQEFQKKINLQLEEGQLPVMVPTEVVIADALWMIFLHDPDQGQSEQELLLNLANLAKVSNTRARQLLIRAFRTVWPKPNTTPEGAAVRLFNALASALPEIASADAGAMGGQSGPEVWRDMITQIYNEHNPAKLGDVDTLLAKYRGRERTLYLGICEKYRVQPNLGPSGMPNLPPPPGAPPGGPLSTPAQEEQVKKFKELICEVYKEHNPTKLDDVDNLLAKYRGREELVYRGICDKYKVEPKVPKAEKKDKDGEDGAPKATSVEKYKQLISEIYEEHNKEKLGEIDELLKKYSGKEKTLYLAVCHKYKIEPKLPGLKKSKKATAVDADAEKAEEKLKTFRGFIVEIYKEHKPEKLDDVDTLLAKYKGREEMLYHGICEKYGVEPKVPKSTPAGAPPSEEKAAPSAAAEADGADKPADGAEKPAEGAEKPAEDAEKPAEGAEAAKEGAEKPAAAEGAEAAKEGGSKPVSQAYADLIREVYKEHNPSKLDSVDALLAKYAKQEQDLYLTVCKKYSVKPKDPDGLGDLDWLSDAEGKLGHLLKNLASILVMHTAGLKTEDAQKLNAWEEVRPRSPPCMMTHRHDFSKLKRAQAEHLIRELHGIEGARFKKLQDRCVGAKVTAPTTALRQAGNESEMALAVVCDSAESNGRASFDNAIAHVSETLGSAVRDCVESDDEAEKRLRWLIPWMSEERWYVGCAGDDEKLKTEVGIEYRRGCWAPRKLEPMHSHSVHHKLAGPDVESRLPDIWRALADGLWQGVLELTWGRDMPQDAHVVIEVSGGRKAQPSSPALPGGCSAAPPGASVVVTASTEEEVEQAKRVVAPVLSQVLSDMRVNALFVPATLFMPQQKKVIKLTRECSDESSSSGDEGMDVDSEEDIQPDAEPSENDRPLRLTRSQVRDAYLQGLLCLNCDAADHKHQECQFRKKVCWNCHGQHAGNDCPVRCRFCKERHKFPLLECVKRVCRRVNDWKKSKSAQEQRSVLSNFEQLMIKMEGFEDISLAKHNVEVQQLVKGLAEQHALFPGMLADVAMSILDMKPPPKKVVEVVIPPPPAGAPPQPYVAPKLPKDLPPAMPENKYPWSEKIFLDTLLSKGMYGANVLSRIIGRGGVHHRRMETESGARVFFRGLGVSGREMDLNEPIDCRLHISVKGDVPQQGQAVRRIVQDIITELDADIKEQGVSGPVLDRPREMEAHPFGFLCPNGTGPEAEEPLKWKFPEEDGQPLNDLLVWLKQVKLPLELDSDTQWRTTLQITPVEAPLPDDAPAESEMIAEAFSKKINDWHYPCPYWFEEHDLRPTGLWTSLADVEEAAPIVLQQGQSVRLSAQAVDFFSAMMDQAKIVGNVPRATVSDVLRRLRGVVRRQAEDEQLLLYLAYPWAWFADMLNRGLKLPFTREQVHSMLVKLGRVGAKPTETNAAPAFRGIIVEWLPLKAGAGIEAVRAPPEATPPVHAAPPVPGGKAPPRGFCKYWLPDAVFLSKQDISELIAGPGGAHFAHVRKKYPSVELRVDGQCSAAVPRAQRLHVNMSSEDSEAFETAAADVLDLVETVCDMVGEELGYNEDQVEALIHEVRAEKYFEAHGIRTPLLPANQSVKMEANAPATAGPAPVVPQPALIQVKAELGTAASAPSQMPVKMEVHAPAPAKVPQPAAEPPAPAPAEPLGGEFEFIDEDIDMADLGAGDDDDDARTEASDALSDLTEPEDGQPLPEMSFDDI